ncbi:MAG: DUF1653 domain-containing protein [Lachnospiraceae bacterium]|nr:DUF1653 domain-containing protein [Lachnospiraceae bacterium]MBQ2467386.1 DUF1653 domain-containing protein [Lachnospiraceae bacterium]
MPQHDPRIGEIYRHFKGNLYQITGIATHSETREKMVVYQALYGDFGTYVRPYDMFISEVDYEKYPEVTAQYRFTLVNPATLRQGSTRTVANPTPQPVSTPVAPSVTAAPKAAPTEETTATPSGEEGVYQHMIAFLDTDDFDKKYELLTEMDMMGELSNHVIDNLAAALDVVIPDGDLDSRADQLKVCVRTRARYESTRLRG